MGLLERHDGPFGFDEAAHLFRRAAFSLPSDELDLVAKGGLDAALERLFVADEGVTARGLADSAGLVTQGSARDPKPSSAPIRSLWLARIAASRAGLREKLALFWHGHFATSLEKVKDSAWMWRQYTLLRESGLGRFRDLLQAVARDPAMLVWLDSDANEKGRPNENFARELMELFSLGVGHYGEKDVQEAARAFSGWKVRNGAFRLDAKAHDDGPKELFGERGPFDGGDVVERCVARDDCPRFLATKLLRFYVTPQPTADAVQEFAARLRALDLEVGAALRELFASKLFFAPASRGVLIQSPVEWCVGTLVKLRGTASWAALAGAVASMGQALFEPPNVKGWDGDRAWINSRTLLERDRFAAAVAYGGEPFLVRVDWARLVDAAGRDDPVRLVAALARLLLQRPPTDATRARLEQFAASADAGSGETRVRRVAHLWTSAPEAQLS
jgi:uncharacterized protein (DUF1800 family)